MNEARLSGTYHGTSPATRETATSCHVDNKISYRVLLSRINRVKSEKFHFMSLMYTLISDSFIYWLNGSCLLRGGSILKFLPQNLLKIYWILIWTTLFDIRSRTPTCNEFKDEYYVIIMNLFSSDLELYIYILFSF